MELQKMELQKMELQKIVYHWVHPKKIGSQTIDVTVILIPFFPMKGEGTHFFLTKTYKIFFSGGG